MRTTLPAIVATLGLLAGAAACTSPGTAGDSASANNSCINPTEIRSQTIVSDQEIRFELRNGEAWVNKLPTSCPGLKTEGGFSWDVRGMRVCSNQESITVLNTGVHCMLGEFTRAPAAS
jgi:Family of unknown function (DUF6491)